jgi:hypothetical protein
MKLTTTLNLIRAHTPCKDGWQKLLTHLGKTEADDEALNLLTILTSNGVQDMLWCLRATVEDSKLAALQMAIEFAEQVLPIFEKRYPNDARPRHAIQAAKDYLTGGITVEQLQAARRDAAYAVASVASAAASVASAAAAYAAARQQAREKQAAIIHMILEE